MKEMWPDIYRDVNTFAFQPQYMTHFVAL